MSFSPSVRWGTKKANDAVAALAQECPAARVDGPIDREQVFMLYASFNGDLARTAHAAALSEMQVLTMADEEDWTGRLRAIIKLKNTERPADVERGINRAMNFVQAHRMRLFLEKMVHRFHCMTEDELFNYCLSEETRTAKDGTVVIVRKASTKPLADLASALEKVHILTYLALNDSVSERSKRKSEDGSGPTTGEIHTAIADAMAKVGASRTPRALLFDAQLAQAQSIADAKAAKERQLLDVPPVLPTETEALGEP